MSQLAWEKPAEIDPRLAKLMNKRGERLKFLIGGLLILGAIGYLILSGTLLGQQFYITVDDLLSNPEYIGQSVRITGAVIGSTIDLTKTTDDGKPIITFTIANLPLRTDNLADALNLAANDPTALILPVYVENKPIPELLQHEAQAILTGKLGTDGIFYVSELQFKCPSRFDDTGPQLGEQDHPGMKLNQG